MLERINFPEDLHNLTESEMNQLALEIREFLVRNVSETGGHLSSNLGVVELTLALCRTFSFPTDKIVFDVGHQSYVYKILTGRKERFSRLRQKDGLSGFPKTSESIYDAADTGHASTSVSAALGLVEARELQQQHHHVIAVIGDGALTGGLAYEALNMAGRLQVPMIVILNDNEMSIGPNVGALSKRLSKVRTGKSYQNLKKKVHLLLDSRDGSESRLSRWIRNLKRRLKYFLLAGTFFEELGFTYLGPVDGHNIRELEAVLKTAGTLNSPVLIHVKTVKGKGYSYAEKNPSAFHGVGTFDPESGEIHSQSGRNWSDLVGTLLKNHTENDPRNVVVCAAMPQGTGTETFAQEYPQHFFDVGIAEEHAVTFASGLARGGIHPWVVIYSTFLQRAYDQILHDVCLEKLPVHFLVDHAGIVGEDGETHQGVFDLAYLCHIPNMTVLAPSTGEELEAMMQYAAANPGPTAIRYPKGKLIAESDLCRPDASCQSVDIQNIRTGYGFLRTKHKDAHICILTLGALLPAALEASVLLEKEGIAADVADARFAAPLSDAWMSELAEQYSELVTVEDHVHAGGFGMYVSKAIGEQSHVSMIALPDQFIPQGKRSELLSMYGLDAAGIAAKIRQLVKNKKDI